MFLKFSFTIINLSCIKQIDILPNKYNIYLNDNEFKPTPKPKACKYCDYQTICRECIEDRVKRKRPSKLEISEADGVLIL